jgi:hypothetical protein
MSDLRDQLQHARTEYLIARYPGNLAVDILWNGNALQPTERHELPPVISRWKILLGSGLGLTGVAALIAMFISLEQTPRSTIRAIPRPQRAQVNNVLSIPPMPATPANVRLVPTGITRISTIGQPRALPAKPPMTKPKPQPL